jgi:fatty-acyl-CoA synthase
VRAPHLFAGYWRDPRATAEALFGDWLRTGDLGHRDAQGYLYLSGRAKETIISGGENIFPAEVEAVLEMHPAVAEAAVAGAADPQWGETVCAIVRLRAGAALSLDALREFCAGKLARYKIPRALVLAGEALPRNASGKLLRQELKQFIGIGSPGS